MEQHESAAQAFFQANKVLFQFEKYVGNQNLLEIESNVYAENGATKTSSFLEQYRRIDRERPRVPAQSELHFSLSHPPARRFSLSNNAAHTTNVPVPEFVSLQSVAIVKNMNNLQCEPIRFHSIESPKRTTQHTHQHGFSITNTHDSAAVAQDASPVREFASKTIANGSLSPQKQQFAIRQSAPSIQKEFMFPKLAELLIDRETRAASAHKSWDEAHKIQVLVGSKCVGRVSAASRNIPPSIRSRLQASANVSVRRERLYNLLHRDYDELSKRYTQ